MVRIRDMATGAVAALVAALAVGMGAAVLLRADPVVNNVRAAQRPGTRLVDILYNLSNTHVCAVAVAVSTNSGLSYSLAATNFFGPGYGAAVPAGADRAIAWDAWADCGSMWSTGMRVRVMADDGLPRPPALGVTAHLSRPGEAEIASRECAMITNAGIGWVRFDTDWGEVQPDSNTWDYSHIDHAVAEARATGLQPLPVLGYWTWWTAPVWEHLDDWRKFVRQTVSRYTNEVSAWEVWNEPNIDVFWGATPNPTQYVAVLQAACQEIKAADTNATVLLGGLSCIPTQYIEGVYAAGGAPYFDVMNVHPYSADTPERSRLAAELEALRGQMAVHGDDAKPIWITEIGWATHQNALSDPQGGMWAGAVRAGLDWIAPGRTNWSLAVLYDPGYPAWIDLDDQALAMFAPGTGAIRRIYVRELASLDPARDHALVMPPSEGFPSDYFDAIEDYVSAGGVLVLTWGVPLCYRLFQDATGAWQQVIADESYRARLRIGWEAWWTTSGVPETVTNWFAAEAFTNEIVLPTNEVLNCRFLRPVGLQGGDQMTNLVLGCNDTYTGAVSAAWRFDSDLRGGLVVSTFGFMGGLSGGVSTNRQAELLPRALALALQTNVAAAFWYEFQAPEKDPLDNESHFGIVHSNLTHKPAYAAYRALARARPAGSRAFEGCWQTNGIYYPHWQRPDAEAAWMLWHPGPMTNARAGVSGALLDAFDHLGRPLAIELQNGSIELELGDAPIYLIGPSALSF